MKAKAIFAVVLPATLLGGGLRTYISYAKPDAVTVQAARPLIPSPSSWIAFDAKLRKTSIEGEVWGRYYRDSDGSERQDTGPAEDDMRVTTIRNVRNSRYYAMNALNPESPKWRSHPMLLPPEGHSPRRWRLGAIGLDDLPWPSKVQGFEVYRYTDAGGVVSYKVPDLNFFNIVTEFGGTRQEFFDIRIREQPPELLRPPPGAIVEGRSTPMGIISERAAKEAGLDTRALGFDH